MPLQGGKETMQFISDNVLRSMGGHKSPYTDWKAPATAHNDEQACNGQESKYKTILNND